MKQPEALRLATQLQNGASGSKVQAEAAAELRRLHEVNAELMGACKDLLVCMKLANWENDSIAIRARAAIAKAEEQK